MQRRIIILLAAILMVASFPSFKTSAHTVQTASKCTNTDFLTGLVTDLGSVSSEIKSLDMTNAAALSKALLDTATLRKKYEDQNNVKGCEDAQVNMIITLANTTDVIALALAVTSDPKNADSYSKDLTAQLDHLKQAVASLTVSLGAATPAPDAPTAQAPISCKDTAFLQGLSADVKSMVDQVNATDATNVGSLTKTLLAVSAIRRKYEDVNFDSDDCLYAQYSLIVSFANASDLIALQIALVADPKNADTYTAALADQGKRYTQSVQQVLVDLGLATPAPDATQAK
jgi:hypothetical protein